jgi:hypothetical protein
MTVTSMMRAHLRDVSRIQLALKKEEEEEIFRYPHTRFFTLLGLRT